MGKPTGEGRSPLTREMPAEVKAQPASGDAGELGEQLADAMGDAGGTAEEEAEAAEAGPGTWLAFIVGGFGGLVASLAAGRLPRGWGHLLRGGAVAAAVAWGARDFFEPPPPEVPLEPRGTFAQLLAPRPPPPPDPCDVGLPFTSLLCQLKGLTPAAEASPGAEVPSADPLPDAPEAAPDAPEAAPEAPAPATETHPPAAAAGADAPQPVAEADRAEPAGETPAPPAEAPTPASAGAPGIELERGAAAEDPAAKALRLARRLAAVRGAFGGLVVGWVVDLIALVLRRRP